MMKSFFSILFFAVALMSTSAHAQFGKEWLTCNSDDDCMKVNGLCNRKDSINKKFIKDFEVFSKKMDSMSMCKELSEKEKLHNENSVAKCVNGSCKLEDLPAAKK